MGEQWTIELADCTGVLIRESEMPEITRDSIALTYAMAMTSIEPKDWPAINRAITKRWPKGLNYIKTKAWKLVEEKLQRVQP